jgi:hypothetical protein
MDHICIIKVNIMTSSVMTNNIMTRIIKISIKPLSNIVHYNAFGNGIHAYMCH